MALMTVKIRVPDQDKEHLATEFASKADVKPGQITVGNLTAYPSKSRHVGYWNVHAQISPSASL